MQTIAKDPQMNSHKKRPAIKLEIPQNTYNIIIAQQSLPPNKYQCYYPFVDVTKKFEESLEKCRKNQNKKLRVKAIENICISKNLSQNIIENYRRSSQISENPILENRMIENGRQDRGLEKKKLQNKKFEIKFPDIKTRERCVSMCETNECIKNRRASELVDQLLLDIYGRGNFQNGSLERNFDTEYGSSTSFKSIHDKFDEKLQYSRLITKDVCELQMLISALKDRINYTGNLLVKQLKKKDALKSKQEKICNVITAHLHAYSDKKSEDTNMRFSPNPVPGDSGFNQWRDAMKMCAKLPGGIPPEFRKKLWVALAEKHLQSKGVNWNQTEKLCFNEWSNPDDSELGIQIVKDLHRTGCSLFCGAAGQENQALLKRVLLAYARWNKSVGYCQGFNMLAALILQVMDKNETDSVKVMIYLIEGVLPESYFANNLRGLSVDMIVFRDLLKLKLPQLSKHLEALQNDAREGNSYEPPLTNVFTMQWFLTLFCNCLPQPTVLRVWDLIFLEGNEILLRTAIAIWAKLSDRILAVNSADEFYSIMGVLTREMLEFGLVDSNTLIKSIVAIGACSELNEMRDKYLYNITPWTQSVQTAAKKGFKLFYSDDDEVESDYDEKAAVTAAYGISIGRRRDKNQQNSKESNVIQPYAHGHPDRERLALDISALKKQYAKLRERQRQAHIILQAACARQPMGQNSTAGPIAMNHLLLGKNAIVNSRGRRLGPPKGSIPPARTKTGVKKKQQAPVGETILWKDTEQFRRRQSMTEETESSETFIPDSDSSSYSEDDDGSSTSTELCDEDNNRLSDFDTEDKNSDILDVQVASDKQESREICGESSEENLVDKNINEEIQSDIKNLMSDIDNLKNSDDVANTSDVSDFNVCELATNSDEVSLSSNINDSILQILDTPIENISIISPENEDQQKSSPASPKARVTVTAPNINLTKDDTSNNSEYSNSPKEDISAQNEEDIFESFLQERIKISKENSADSVTSPKEDLDNLMPPEEKLRRHKSVEEAPKKHSGKSIFKQASFDVNVVPSIETSLWTPYQIEEETEDNQKTETPHKPLTKQSSVDLLTVEDKRLEAGRRNSERALRIIQENSLILHRILLQQKSSDSEEELSKSPISKTFMRSESLLSKDEKTDEERSSKDGDEELESGVESFSLSPALIDEKSDRSLKKDLEENEKLIVAKNEGITKVIYKITDEKSNLESKKEVKETENISEHSFSKNINVSPQTPESKEVANLLESYTGTNKDIDVFDIKCSDTGDAKVSPNAQTNTAVLPKLIISPMSPINTNIAGRNEADLKDSMSAAKHFDISSQISDRNVGRILESSRNKEELSNLENPGSKSYYKEITNVETPTSQILALESFILSPLSPDSKNIPESSTINEEICDLQEDSNYFKEATNMETPVSSFPASKQFSMSPVTSEDTHIASMSESDRIKKEIRNFEEDFGCNNYSKELKILETPISLIPASKQFSLSPGTPIDKNIASMLGSNRIKREIQSFEEDLETVNYSNEVKTIESHLSSISASKQSSISPLTPESKNIFVISESSRTSEEIPNIETDSSSTIYFEESINTDTFVSSISASKEFSISPLTPDNKNASSFLESSRISEVKLSPSTSTKETVNNERTVSSVFASKQYIPPLTPEDKNITSIEETSINEDIRNFEEIASTTEYFKESIPVSSVSVSKPSNISPIAPDYKNILNTPNKNQEIPNKITDFGDLQNLISSSEGVQYNSWSTTSHDENIKKIENISPQTSENTKFVTDSPSSDFKKTPDTILYSSSVQSTSITELAKDDLKNISSFTNSKHFVLTPTTPEDTTDKKIVSLEGNSGLKLDLQKSPDIHSTISSSKHFSISPITPKEDHILSCYKTTPQKSVDNKNTSDESTFSSTKQYNFWPITPSSTQSNFLSTSDKSHQESRIRDENSTQESDFKGLLEATTDISSYSPSKQFIMTPISPLIALNTYQNIIPTQIEKSPTLEALSKIEDRSLDEKVASPISADSYKFTYKFSEDNSDINTTKLQSNLSEKLPVSENISSGPSKNMIEDISASEHSPDYAQYLKSDNLTDVSKKETNVSLFEELKDDFPFKMEETYACRNVSPHKFKFREDSEDSMENKFDSPVMPTSNKYTFDSPISTERFSTNFTDKSSDYKPEDSKYTYEFGLDSPDYTKSNIIKPKLEYSPAEMSKFDSSVAKPSVYSPDDVSSVKTKDFDSSSAKRKDFETKSKTDNNYLLSGQEKKYDRTKLTIDLEPRRYKDASPEISPPKHLSCLQFTSFQAEIPCTSKAIQFSPICNKEKEISPKSPKSAKYLINLPTLSPPRRALKSPLSPNRAFSPFPVQPIARQPKELGVKLGLYKDLKSPNK